MAQDTWAAVVVRPGITWFARAGRYATSKFTPTPDFAGTNVPRLVLAASVLWFRDGEGVLLWQCRESLNTRALVQELRERGCTVSDSGHETGWFTIRRPDVPNAGTVHLGIGKLISQQRTPVTPLHDAAKDVATRLALYAELTGAAWRGTAGMSGNAGVRAEHERKTRGGQPLWRWDTAPAEPTRCSFELRSTRYQRPMSDQELPARHVHEFDIRAMYLAAANVAMCGWSAPEERGPQEFDPARPGYWQIMWDHVSHAPAELVRPADPGNLIWVTTPVMAYLVELYGQAPEVFASWTSERGGRYLKPWAERLTAALHVGDEHVLKGVKATYKQAVGMFAKEGGRIYRPDWRDEVVDRARVNLLRKVYKSGYTPLRYNTDALWIATDDEARKVGKALGVGYDPEGREVFQVGKFRHIRTMEPAEYLERYDRVTLPPHRERLFSTP